MVEFSIEQLFPDFILADQNGYALAKGIERGLQMMCETVKNGMDVLQNVDKMPEWRLDEMAWELDCLYDYSASVAAKRVWIKNAKTLMEVAGTPKAIIDYLEGYFSDVQVEEWWQYDGEPYHFRVICNGDMSPEKEQWVRYAIEKAKNVRSVLDALTIYKEAVIIVQDEPLKGAKQPVLFANDMLYCVEEGI